MRSAPEIPPALAHCRSRVPVTAHVRPEVKAELERLARQGNGKGEALSLSQTAAALLEQGIQGHIDMQYGALLRPVIEAAIKNEVQSFANRSASLTVNAFYAAEQARILCITIASLLLGEQTDVLPGIVAECQKQAHANLGRNLWREQEGEEG